MPTIHTGDSLRSQKPMPSVHSAETLGASGLNEIEALKNQANNLYTEGKFQQAILGYTYALNQAATALLPAQRRQMINLEHAPSVSSAIRDASVPPKGRKLAAALYNNRAAAYLKLLRYEKAALDASAAATIDPDNFKAWLRKATAHKELGQWYECNQAVKSAMRIDEKDNDILQLLEESQFKMGAGMPAPTQQVPVAASGRGRRW